MDACNFEASDSRTVIIESVGRWVEEASGALGGKDTAISVIARDFEMERVRRYFEY